MSITLTVTALLDILAALDGRRQIIDDLIKALTSDNREPTADELAKIRDATASLDAEWAALAPSGTPTTTTTNPTDGPTS